MKNKPLLKILLTALVLSLMCSFTLTATAVAPPTPEIEDYIYEVCTTPSVNSQITAYIPEGYEISMEACTRGEFPRMFATLDEALPEVKLYVIFTFNVTHKETDAPLPDGGHVYLELNDTSLDKISAYRLSESGEIAENMGYISPYADTWTYVPSNGTVSIAMGRDRFEGFIKGDADMDGEVTVKDATLIQKSLVKIETLGITGTLAATVDDNLAITIADATEIQKYVAGIEVTSQVGEGNLLRLGTPDLNPIPPTGL